MKKLLIASAFCALLAGCGQAEEKANASFDKNFQASCVSSSVKVGAPPETAAKVCECTLAEINKKFSATEKLTMSKEQAQPIMAECLNKVMQK